MKAGQTAGVVARELGLIEQALRNWVKEFDAGKLKGPGAKQVTPEQMELSRVRAENLRLRRENASRARHKRRFKATTDSNLPVAPNVLERNFTPTAPKRVWTAHLTYIQTDKGWLYLPVVLDLFNHEVVGWSIKARMTMAWFRRKPALGLMHHSDRGSQYASHGFQAQLEEYGMICSMSRKGNCWDNGPTESFLNSLKNERVHGTRYATRDEAIADLFDHIEPFHNRRRRHSTLGGDSPARFLENWISAQQAQESAA